MSTSTHTVTFSRLRASFTVDKDLIGKQDPYVVFQSGSAKAQTKAIKGVGTGTAEWKESYTLENFSPSSSSVIEVTVYNHNTLLPDSVIGAGTVDLGTQGQSSLSGSGEPISIVLVDKKGQEVGTLQFVTNGGGYTGRGTGTGTTGSRTGTGVGAGTGAGVGAGSGVGHHGHHGHHSGVGTGAAAAGAGTGAGVGAASGVGHHGHHGHHSGVGTGAAAAGAGAAGGAVVGKGIGSDKATAQHASDRAAAEGRSVTVEDRDRVGVGHPAGTTGTGVGTGTGTGVGTGTGHHHHHGHHGHHTGTGVAGATGVTGTGVAATERDAVYGVKEGDVIDRKYYVGTEARPQDQALVEQYREHNPYAKDYETTVQHTGRERLVDSQIEALGTRERVIGQDHQVHAHPHTEIARNLPAGAIDQRPGGEGWVQTKPGPICDTNTFSVTGDRTVDKERVTDLREHREFEKEFEVKTRLVGERALERGTDAEILNRERVLVDEKNKNACEGHPEAGNVAGATLADSTGTGYGSSTTGVRGSSTTGVGGTGYGSQTGTGVGSGTGYGSQTGTGVGSGTGTGYGSQTGTGVGSGTGYGSQTGTGVGSGTGTGYGSQTGTGVGSGTGYGSQTGTGVGSGTGTGYGSQTGTGVGSGTGYGSHTGTGTGSTGGYGTGSGSGQRSTAGEKAAGFIPGTEEHADKRHGYQPGQGPDQNQGNVTAGEKAASYIPGTTENREKKTGQYS